MSDLENRLTRELGAYADAAVRPIDANEIAERAAPDRRVIGIRTGLRWFAVAAVLIALLVAALLVIGSGSRARPFADTTAVPTRGQSGSSITPLLGAWIAEKPASISFGFSDITRRMAMVVDGNGSYTYVRVAGEGRERLPARSTYDDNGQATFETKAASEPVTIDGTELRGCAIGEVGTYRTRRSDDGLRLTLEVLADACPSRSAVLARTWTRTLGEPNGGGPGVIDAFDPMYTVELPAGSYSVDRSANDAITVIQTVPEFQFLAWKDPQGFNDPCDPVGKGRYPIARGADAFVAYFRLLAGFTVDSVSELQVDGHRAVRLVVHANVDASCPDGQLWEWQPKAESNGRWFLRPGDTDKLVIVELADATVMFEVLGSQQPQEAEAQEAAVIGSIRFLDRLPSTP
jgi:hypothetical protein